VNVSRRQDAALIGHPRGGAVAAAASPRPRPRRWLALLLALLLLLLSGPPLAPAAALDLPWRRGAAAASAPPAGRRSLPLQELSPPAPVRQLQAALAGRQPVVEILSPRDDSLLDGSPWTLQLRLHDWPLVQAGALGPGPHVVVQLDQEPPRIWTELQGTLPPLSPGSHRLTVYAALPWGEALRTPGAWQQIRLHRTAANPLVLPARGSPQLLAVSPPPRAGAEPLLLDWLLLDAPLQHLRGSATNPWRLRVSLNGDSFLLDQQTPLWLQGWRPGVNALRLELLDDHGDPLNPPFNSLVQEVVIDPAAPAPRWLGEPLSAAELAVLLGRAPAPERLTPAVAAPVPPGGAVARPRRDRSRDQPPAAASAPSVPAPSLPPTPSPAEPASAEPASTQPAGAEPAGAEPAGAGPVELAGAATASAEPAEPASAATTGAEPADPAGTEAAEAAGDDASRAESTNAARPNSARPHSGSAGSERAIPGEATPENSTPENSTPESAIPKNAGAEHAGTAGAGADRARLNREEVDRDDLDQDVFDRDDGDRDVGDQDDGDRDGVDRDSVRGADAEADAVRGAAVRASAEPIRAERIDAASRPADRSADRTASASESARPPAAAAPSPGGRARDLVAADGTLLRQPSPGPLQRLRSSLMS